jgi:hypothetical protein
MLFIVDDFVLYGPEDVSRPWESLIDLPGKIRPVYGSNCEGVAKLHDGRITLRGRRVEG